MSIEKKYLFSPYAGLILFLAILAGCALPKPSVDTGPIGKVTSVSSGGAYVEQQRGSFGTGDEVVIFQRECKETPVRGGPMKNCSYDEYGTGKVERRLEDGHLFIRSNAVSIPIGSKIKRPESGR